MSIVPSGGPAGRLPALVDDGDRPLSLRQLLVRVVVVPGLVVVVALGAVMAVLNAAQHPTSAPARLAGAASAVHHGRRAHRPRPLAARTSAPEAAAGPTRASRVAPVPPAPPHRLLGAYVGPGAASAWTALSAGVPHGLGTAMDYLDDQSWSSIATPTWFLDQWKPLHLPMTYLVPMLPLTGASLAGGAAGAYDAAFASLARSLVDAGEGRATLVLGADPLQPGQPWSVYTRAAAAQYVAYYRRIVETMRAVPGGRFRFAYQPGPTSPGGGLGPGSCYPGNRYVAVVATQVFDQLTGPPRAGQSRFAALLAAPYGLGWTARFAARLHRGLVVDGLGLVPAGNGGAGDDPGFVSAFFGWARAHHVVEVDLWSEGSTAFVRSVDPRAFAAVASLAASRAWS